MDKSKSRQQEEKSLNQGQKYMRVLPFLKKPWIYLDEKRKRWMERRRSRKARQELKKANSIIRRHILKEGFLIPDKRAVSEYIPVANRVMYVAAMSLPYSVVGYSSRTQGILKAIKSAGVDLFCVTRPGYPEDRGLVLKESLQHEIDGVGYEVLPGSGRALPLDQQIEETANIIVKKAQKERPAIIHAASNYENALPALIAARRLGIPFIYEVRGLWEWTAASKKNYDYENSDKFLLQKTLEATTARNADHVFTLTQGLAMELKERGVEINRISLAPNAIDPSSYAPVSRNQELWDRLKLNGASFVIGYIGSIAAYEGLDDLIKAFRILLKQKPDARLVIVGDGDELDLLKVKTRKYGLEKKIIFTGKVPSKEVHAYYSILNVIALPRKPFKVCQLVSPLKPLEAMAMNIPMVVSDVQALKEMVIDGETALVHKSGNAESLADCLLRIANEPGLSKHLAYSAHQFVVDNRTWDKIAVDIKNVYLSLTKEFEKSVE